MFGAISEMIENARGLTINQALSFSLEKQENKEYIIFLNTDSQLFQKGENSEGVQLSDIGGNYSPVTVQLKKLDSLPFDRVTLFQEGDYYDTFRVDVGDSSFTIDSDPMKEGGSLFDSWGHQVEGLTDESIEELIEVILPAIIEYVIGTLFDIN